MVKRTAAYNDGSKSGIETKIAFMNAKLVLHKIVKARMPSLQTPASSLSDNEGGKALLLSAGTQALDEPAPGRGTRCEGRVGRDSSTPLGCNEVKPSAADHKTSDDTMKRMRTRILLFIRRAGVFTISSPKIQLSNLQNEPSTIVVNKRASLVLLGYPRDEREREIAII